MLLIYDIHDLCLISCVAVHSSVLGDMFEGRLSDRLDQLLPVDATRRSWGGSSRLTDGGVHADRGSLGDELVRKFLLEEEAARLQPEPAVLPPRHEPMASTSKARARAKLDARAKASDSVLRMCKIENRV